MNNLQIENILRGYPVIVCSADQLTRKPGYFFISNTQTSDQRGEHWTAFYFKKRGPDEFFDSLGNQPGYYGQYFNTVLNKPYLCTLEQIQESDSDVCGAYCIYYVICRYAGLDFQTILNTFDVRNRKKNDDVVVEMIT